MFEYSDKDGIIRMNVEGSTVEILDDVSKMLHILHVKLTNQNLIAGRTLEAAFKDPEFIEDIFKPDANDRKLLEG